MPKKKKDIIEEIKEEKIEKVNNINTEEVKELELEVIKPIENPLEKYMLNVKLLNETKINLNESADALVDLIYKLMKKEHMIVDLFNRKIRIKDTLVIEVTDCKFINILDYPRLNKIGSILLTDKMSIEKLIEDLDRWVVSFKERKRR